MATLVIGDVHGCFATLERLLEEIDHDRSRDRLWFTGDLVNRGPRSLEVVRWVIDQGDDVVSVLGNHDLHLVACARGIRREKAKDTFGDVLSAPDSDGIVNWLAGRPLLHREGDFVLVHAGLIPSWSVDEAISIAEEVRRGLDQNQAEYLAGMYAEGRDHFSKIEDPTLALQAALRVLVSIRTCTPDGRLHTGFAGSPDEAPEGFYPWFEARKRRGSEQVIFGHWAALGLHLGDGFIGLDTGCAWGGSLTAYRLDDGRVFQVPRID